MENNLNEMYENFKQFTSKETKEVIEEIKTGNINLDKIIKDYLTSKDKRNFDTSIFYSSKYSWGISMADLSKLDLRKVPVKLLMRIPFSTETKWPPKDKMPKGFEPEKIIEQAKTFKGLGVEELHQQGNLGQGIKIAYIDKPFDIEHEEFKGAKIEYTCYDKYNEFNFHGYSVASRVVGQNIGIAPKAKMIYYACGHSEKYDDYFEGYTSQVLKAVNDVVSRAKNGEEISAIGMSSDIIASIESLQNTELKIKFKDKWKKLSAELEKLDIPFIDSTKFHKDFNYAVKFDPLKQNGDLNNFYSSMVFENRISVIDADKCVPMPYTKKGYKYENSLGCESWSIPQITAIFALAKQTNPNLSFEEFVEISRATAKENSNGTKLINSIELIKEVEYRKENENVLTFDEN